MPDKQLDIVVYGATAFVGKILCHHLLETLGTDGDLRWGLAGRSRAKLEALHQELGAPAGLPLFVADGADEAALAAFVRQTRVVISTIGPYALHGEPLVRVCAETGTDYCDLTGEVHWIRRMIRTYEDVAKRSGARIVHCCGFDSLPSDLGVHYLQQQAQERFGQPCQTIHMRVRGAKGGASGGTIASVMNMAREASADKDVLRQLANPFSLCPDDFTGNPRQTDLKGIKYDADVSAWVAPFFMAAINTRVVHRSHALQGGSWGSDFIYEEGMMMGKGVKGWFAAGGFTLGLGTFALLSFTGPARRFMERFVLPKPGEGPDAAARERGYWDLIFIGRTASGDTLRTRVTGDRDPGYGSTAKMLAQAGICLARDFTGEEKNGGFPTPATVLGSRLIARLTEHAGVTFATL